MSAHEPTERGSATLLMVTVIALLAAAAVGAAIIGVYLEAVHRARAGADLTAVSAAVEHSRGGAACRIAEQVASRNEVRLIDCEVVAEPAEFAVSVTVEVPVNTRVGGLPRAVRARAHAGRVDEAPP
ncbi:Rv3654c family TadE-like protein [Enemella sp. A6]|uniref:Rv3654c family TadE-like protein n=1 Tax=Enemella sp. A6 TaxID=3440152 RepID=UPI003EB89790